MDILTNTFIDNIINAYEYEDGERYILTNDAFDYVRFLLSPYVDAMKYIDTPNDLITWIEELFAYDDVGIKILNTIDKYERESRTSIDDIKQAILVGLLESLFFEGEIDTNEEPTTSWDIKTILGFEGNENIAKYFGKMSTS